MKRELLHLGIMVTAAALAACAGRAPATMNAFSGPDRRDSEVAVFRSVDWINRIVAVDGNPVQHPDSENFYYREVRLIPGRHSFTVDGNAGFGPQALRDITVDLAAGHNYEFHLVLRRQSGDKEYFWVKDITSGAIVAGERP
jgi:hypothetical protein